MVGFSDKRLKFQPGAQQKLIEKASIEFGSQRKLSNFLGCGEATLRGWKREESNMPKSAYLKISKKCKGLGCFGTLIENEMDWNWGRAKGGERRIANIKDMGKYLEYVRSFPKKNRLKSKVFGIKIVNSLLEELKSQNVDLLSMLAICTLTDGCLVRTGKSFRINFSTSDKVLMNFVEALLFELSDYYPRIYGPVKRAFNVCVSDNNLAEKLLEYSPDYKTFASDFAKQPTISFLKGKNLPTKIWAIRFAFTADGCVFVPARSKPGLELACCNKSLCDEWLSLLSGFGINGNIVHCRRAKEGVVGVRIYCREGINNFYKLGGFVDRVKISRKSKYHQGMSKNALLEKVVKSGREGI